MASALLSHHEAHPPVPALSRGVRLAAEQAASVLSECLTPGLVRSAIIHQLARHRYWDVDNTFALIHAFWLTTRWARGSDLDFEVDRDVLLYFCRRLFATDLQDYKAYNYHGSWHAPDGRRKLVMSVARLAKSAAEALPPDLEVLELRVVGWAVSLMPWQARADVLRASRTVTAAAALLAGLAANRRRHAKGEVRR